MFLDIHIRLAYRPPARPPALARPTAIGRAGPHARFGDGFRHARQFRPYFLDALAAAATAYPDAEVEVGEGRVTPRPSRPPVPRLA